MKRTLWVVAVVIVLAVVAGGLWLARQTRPAPAAAQILPASTLLLVDTPNFVQARTGFTNTTAYAFLQEPQIQGVLAIQQRALAEALGAKPEQLADDLRVVRDAIQGEAFVAVTRLALLPVPTPTLVIGADLKANALKSRAVLAYKERSLRKYNPGAEFTSARHHGVTYSIWRFGIRHQLYHAWFGSMVVFTTEEEAMRDLIARWRGRTPAEAPALADSPGYNAVLAGLPKPAAVVSFLNTDRLTQLAGLFLMAAGQGGSLQRLARLQATGLATSYAGRDIVDTGCTVYRHDSPALRTNTTHRTLTMTGPATMLYAVHPMNWGTSYQDALDGLARNDKAMAAATKFERALRQQGLKPRTDFFDQLGPETAMFATWRDGAKFPDFALAVELQPNAKAHLVTVMQALKDAFIGPEPEWEQNGEFVTIRLGDGLIAPTYTVAGDFLVLASTPDYARTLRQSRADTLATRLTSGLPANAHEYFYCDIAGLARPLIAQLRLTTPDLPATDGLVRHLTPYRSATVTQPRLETTTTISPFGKPLTVLAGAAGIFAAVKPYLPPLDLGFTATPATTSSNTPTPLPPAENQKATSVE